MAVGNGSKLIDVCIDPDTYRVEFYFEGSSEPWSLVEFVAGSSTHARLAKIENAIHNFNVTGGVK